MHWLISTESGFPLLLLRTRSKIWGGRLRPIRRGILSKKTSLHLAGIEAHGFHGCSNPAQGIKINMRKGVWSDVTRSQIIPINLVPFSPLIMLDNAAHCSFISGMLQQCLIQLLAQRYVAEQYFQRGIHESVECG